MKVYFVSSEYLATLKVYVVDSEYLADQKVYAVDSEYLADMKVYRVDSEYLADMKVYLVDSEYLTGSGGGMSMGGGAYVGPTHWYDDLGIKSVVVALFIGWVALFPFIRPTADHIGLQMPVLLPLGIAGEVATIVGVAVSASKKRFRWWLGGATLGALVGLWGMKAGFTHLDMMGTLVFGAGGGLLGMFTGLLVRSDRKWPHGLAAGVIVAAMTASVSVAANAPKLFPSNITDTAVADAQDDGLDVEWQSEAPAPLDPADNGSGVSATPGATTAGTLAPGTAVFDPVNGQWGLYPLAEKETLSAGDTGDLVRYLQGVLRAAGHPEVDIDGRFGPATTSAVEGVQALFELAVDGTVGPQTWSVIDFLAQAPATP